MFEVRSRQLVARKERKKMDMRRARSMAELLKENEEFKKQLNQNDDTITELDLELRDVREPVKNVLAEFVR